MPPLAYPSDAFRLGSVVVIPSLNRLVVEGADVDLEPRVMRVLARLAEAPGEAVSRQDLFDAVWPDTVVNDEALTRAVSELRKALGQDRHEVVETIRGTGYRLARPVQQLGSPAPSPARSPRPPAGRGRRPLREVRLALVALGLAAIALAVAVWAALPREVPDESRAAEAEPFELDSTSQYYAPGLSPLGVYYDSSTGRHFRFEDRTE